VVLPRRPVALLAAAGLLFLALYQYLLRDVGLAIDEWAWLLYRPVSFHGLLDPYNKQPIIGQILVYRSWTTTLGVAHRAPLTLGYAAMHLAVASLVYVMARRRVGAWPALGVAVLVLFMGRAWETLLFPGTLSFMLPTLAACVAWSALDRSPRPPTQVAVAGLLAVAGLSGGLIPAVLAGLSAELVAARAWRRLWIVAAAAAPLGAWYVVQANIDHVVAGAGRDYIQLEWDPGALVTWAGKLVAAAAGATVGLPPEGGLAVLAVVGVGLFAWRRTARSSNRFPTPRALGLAVALTVAVLVSGVARSKDTPPTSSRYLYFPAIVLLLLACEGAAGLPVPRTRLAAIGGGAVVAGALFLGVQELRDGKVFYRRASDGTAARMGALRLVAGRLPPSQLVVEPSRLAYSPTSVENVHRRFGDAPIHTPARLARALPESRAAADQVLASALVRPAPRAPAGCRLLAGGDTGALPRGDWIVAVRAGRPTVLELRRFADAGGGVRIPVSSSHELAVRVADVTVARPWRLRAPGASIRICPAGRPSR
jgi:hypothetical protein